MSLVLAISFLVVGTGALIISNTFFRTRATVTSLTESLFREVSRQVELQTRSRVLPAVPAVELLRLRLAGDLSSADRDTLAPQLLDVLRANPQFTWVSYSDVAGGFTGTYRTASGGYRYNFSTIRDGHTVLDEYDVDAAGHRTLARHQDDSHYDPRARPFYQLAAERHTRVWTAPYVFFEQNVPGITCASPVYAPDGALRGVLTVDFDLEGLSAFVARLRLSPNGRVFLFTRDGTVLAHPSAQIVSHGDGERALHNARDLPDPLVRAYYAAATERTRGDATQFAFRFEGRDYFASFLPFEVDEELHWVVGAVAPESDFLAAVERSNVVSLLLSLVALAVALVLAVLLANRLSERLSELAAEMAAVGRFHLDDTPSRPTLVREIALMNRALASMKTGLHSFARYVPRDLVRAMLAAGQPAELGGRTRTLTVFFSDIAGFTSLAEELSPDALVHFLGGYLDEMTGVIAAHKGTVDKFIGDGIMAFWGAPEDLPDHARAACEAALGCQRRLREMKETGRPEMQSLATRIGLATGEVLVGNIGTHERMNYTAMGDVVNLAARLEGLNKQYGTRTMASEETVRAAGDGVLARAIDVVAVKGKARGVKVYELLAADEPDARALIALCERALQAYLARDFAAAAALYDRVLALREGDRPAMLMRERARAYAANAPGEAWDGVYVAKEK